jgi:hypothetical protein
MAGVVMGVLTGGGGTEAEAGVLVLVMFNGIFKYVVSLISGIFI